jgi:transposase-like protein
LSTQLLANMDFSEATDRLTKGVSLADVARELGASYGLIRQSRMDQASPSYRKPPAGWKSAVVRLAEERANELLQLKREIELEEGD